MVGKCDCKCGGHPGGFNYENEWERICLVCDKLISREALGLPPLALEPNLPDGFVEEFFRKLSRDGR